MHKRALIFYSRLACEGLTFKSRLGKEVGNQDAINKIAIALILDLLDELVSVDNAYDFIYYYQPGLTNDKACIDSLRQQYPSIQFREQDPQKDTEAMGDAFQTMLDAGYNQLVLIGSDLPFISQKVIQQAFAVLQESDVVIHPAEDKGYGLVGMNGYKDVFSDVKNWQSRSQGFNLVEETRNICKTKGYSLTELQPDLIDIDYLADVKAIMEKISDHGKLKSDYTYLTRFFTEVQASAILS